MPSFNSIRQFPPRWGNDPDPLEGRSTLRPADILVFGWAGGKHACVDLTGVSPLVGFRENGFVAGQAALKAESSKVAKHEKACLENQHVIIPFAFDTFGFLAPETEKFLNRVQRVVQSNCSTPKAQNFIFSRIGFAIQKGVAAQLVARLPAILLLISNDKVLWVKIIKAFHGQEGGFDSLISSLNNVWSKIVGSSNFLHSNGILPNDPIRFRVGCGSSVRFWKDIWTCTSPLYIRFNRLFRLEKDVQDRLKDNQWEWNWSRSFLRVQNTAYLHDMINDISHIELNLDRDICYWVLSNDGTFFVSSTRNLIDTSLLPALNNPTYWEKCVPRKVNIFMWRCMLDSLPHRSNLSSRGIDIPCIGFPLCNAYVESSNHIFFDCDNAKVAWDLVRTWSNVTCPMCASFDQWKVCWTDWLKSPLMVSSNALG
nr:putative exostosin-like protein [Tanacetum cinerariifolium]